MIAFVFSISVSITAISGNAPPLRSAIAKADRLIKKAAIPSVFWTSNAPERHAALHTARRTKEKAALLCQVEFEADVKGCESLGNDRDRTQCQNQADRRIVACKHARAESIRTSDNSIAVFEKTDGYLEFVEAAIIHDACMEMVKASEAFDGVKRARVHPSTWVRQGGALHVSATVLARSAQSVDFRSNAEKTKFTKTIQALKRGTKADKRGRENRSIRHALSTEIAKSSAARRTAFEQCDVILVIPQPLVDDVDLSKLANTISFAANIQVSAYTIRQPSADPQLDAVVGSMVLTLLQMPKRISK